MAKKTKDIALSETVISDPAMPKIGDPFPGVRMGDGVLFVGNTGVQPAIATSDQDGTHLSLTAFPPGLPPMAFTGVEEDAQGQRKFSWRRR